MGKMALEGNDPRTWDLRQLCAAFEYQVRIGCKDETQWQRERQKLYAPPRGMLGPAPPRGSMTASASKGRAGGPKPPPMAAGDASAFLAAMSSEDRTYGAG